MVKLVLFDLDGTLFDSSPGIFHTANYTMRVLGRDECHDEKTLRKFVGPPLRDCFTITYGITDDALLDECVKVYRKEYRRKGMHMCSLYLGIKELVTALRGQGVKTGVCTNKTEALAKSIFEENNLVPLFDLISGTDEKGSLTKAALIENACSVLGVRKEEAVMIGDTENDEDGAAEAHVPFIGVTWGFGFEKKSDIKKGGAVSHPSEILDYIKERNMEAIKTERAPGAIGPYSQGVRIGSLIFCSGQIPADDEGNMVRGDVKAQTEQCFKNITAVLEEAGASISNVVKATVFLKDMKDFSAMNEVYAKVFSSSSVLPARSAVQVSALPRDALVEIEVIAVV